MQDVWVNDKRGKSAYLIAITIKDSKIILQSGNYEREGVNWRRVSLKATQSEEIGRGWALGGLQPQVRRHKLGFQGPRFGCGL